MNNLFRFSCQSLSLGGLLGNSELLQGIRESMDQDMRLFCRNLTPMRMTARLSGVSVIILLFLISGASCYAAQTPSTTSESNAVAALHPALEEVSSALRQVQIEHWKVSREWKEQFGNDANSIQQDINGPLAGLFQTAQQSPTALEPQFVVMHNVDALYNVLVRLATAADLCGGKTDSATLDNALQNLESARKAVSAQLMQETSSQDQTIVKLQSQLQTAQSSTATANSHTQTIVVDNKVTHKTKHHKPVPPPQTTTPPAHSGTGP